MFSCAASSPGAITDKVRLSILVLEGSINGHLAEIYSRAHQSKEGKQRSIFAINFFSSAIAMATVLSESDTDVNQFLETQKFILGTYANLGAAHVGLAQIYGQNNENINALAEYQKAVEAFHVRITLIPTLFETFAGRASAYAGAADILVNLKKYSEAKAFLKKSLVTYDQALALKPGNTFLLQNQRLAYRILSHVSNKLSNSKDAALYKELSIASFSKAIVSDRKNVHAYVDRAETYVFFKEHSLAAKDFQRAVTAAPERLDYRVALARQLMMAGNDASALEQYQHIYQRVGRHPVVWDEITKLVNKIGDSQKESEEVYKKIKQIGDKYPNTSSDYYLKNLPEHPRAQDLYNILNQALPEVIGAQLGIVGGHARPPERFSHQLGDVINLVAPSLIPGGQIASAIGGFGIDRAVKSWISRFEKWDKLKAQNIQNVLRGVKLEGKNGFVENICKDIISSYGKTIEYLELTPIGLIAFTATIIDRMFIEMANNPELIKKVKKGETDVISAFEQCIMKGKANRLVPARGRVKQYDASEIIQGKYYIK